jgi:hypothetical protein
MPDDLRCCKFSYIAVISNSKHHRGFKKMFDCGCSSKLRLLIGKKYPIAEISSRAIV